MNRYFALFEIIGFESLVLNNSPQEVDDIYSALRKQIKDSIIDWRRDLYKERGYVEIEVSFSGKHIIIATENNSSASLFYICSISQFVIVQTLSEGLPLIGCIHCSHLQDLNGLAKTDDIPRHETLRRPGYWEAVSAVEIGIVAGCLLTAAALSNFEEVRTDRTYTISDLYKLNLLVPLPIAEFEKEAIAINWMANQHINFSHGFILSLFSKHNKEIDDRIEKIIDNTVAFITIVQSERLN